MDVVVDQAIRERINFLKESQFWTPEQYAEFQVRSLADLAGHAYSTVPFYRNLYDHAGFNPATRSGLSSFPFTCKEDMIAAGVPYHDQTMPQDELLFMTTGGSTGNPFKIYMDEGFKAFNHANTFYYMDMVGFNPFDFKSVRLHGDILPETLTRNGTYWLVKNEGRQLVLSSHHLSETTCAAYVEAINLQNPDYLHAFPSVITLLLQYMRKKNLKFNFRPRCIFCDCETLIPGQLRELKEFFACPVYNTYGHTEGAVLGISCPESEFLHMNPVVGIFELLDAEDQPVAGEEKRGDIVVTGFNNRVTPFIRYRTRDIGIHTEQKCPCGRKWPLLRNVEGRIQDYIVDDKGGVVPLGPALFDYNMDWSGVDRFQVFQDTPGRLLVRFVPSAAGSADLPATSRYLEKTLKTMFGGSFRMEVRDMEAIPYTVRGKYRYLEQKLDMKRFFEKAG